MQEMTKKYPHLQNSPELRAYLYQNINELEPHLLPNSSLSFSFKKIDDTAKKNAGAYKVKFVLDVNEMQIESRSIELDAFDAIRGAKETLLAQLFSIEDQLDTLVGQGRSANTQKTPLN